MVLPVTYLDFWHEPSLRWLIIAASIDDLDDSPETQLSCLRVVRNPGQPAQRMLDGMRARSVAASDGTI